MIDQYPTRKSNVRERIMRTCPILWNKNNTWLNKHIYSESGWHHVKSILAMTELPDVNNLVASDSILLNYEPENETVLRSALGVHRLPEYEHVLEAARELASQILGDDIYVHQSRINFKRAGGSGWHAHSDFETWHSQDGMPLMQCCTVMIPLSENGPENGMLELLSGSHKHFFPCKKAFQPIDAEKEFANQTEGLPSNEVIKKYLSNDYVGAKCSPGDAIVFDCNTLHRSADNNSDQDRINLFFVFNRNENRLVEPFSRKEHRPVQMAEIA